MNFTLVRDSATKWGVFGHLEFWGTEETFCQTLEHAYPNEDGTFSAKIPVGEWTCKKGIHQLANSKEPFTTFELQNVPYHTGLLLHVGNYNEDSSGCILIGKKPSMDQWGRMIAQSKETFTNFMKLQSACSEFILTVQDGTKTFKPTDQCIRLL
jgi:hypothetical protein